MDEWDEDIRGIEPRLAGGKNTHDLVHTAVQAHALADDLLIATKMCLPEFVPQQHHLVVVAFLVFFRKKVAPKNRLNFQHAEEASRHHSAFYLFGNPVVDHVRG